MKVNSQNRSGRVTRSSVNGTRNVLNVSGKEPGYEYRIVNDSGDRVVQMQERGYEIVADDSVRVGDRRVANPSKEGSPVMASVGNGMKAYVMRIKKDWYEEDQAAKQTQVDETVEAIKADAIEKGLKGKIEIR